jgi:hypothetical protein
VLLKLGKNYGISVCTERDYIEGDGRQNLVSFSSFGVERIESIITEATYWPILPASDDDE